MKKEFFYALHVLNVQQALEEAEKVLTPDGAHGLILVNNGFHVTAEELFQIWQDVKLNFIEFEIGINPLGMKTNRAIDTSVRIGPDMLWVDDGGIRELLKHVWLEKEIRESLEKLNRSSTQYWGSLALKGPKYAIQSLAEATKYACQHFDVVVTSGPGTGVPPPVEKIQLMKAAMVADVRFAGASGISTENVHLYLDYLDIFIVGTSLTRGDEFTSNPEKVKRFREAIKK